MRSILFAACFVVAACAGASKEGPGAKSAENGSGDDQVCHEVTDTGSMFSHQECTSKADKKDQHDSAERFMQKENQRATPTNHH